MSGAPNIDYAGGASAVEWPKTLYNLLKLDEQRARQRKKRSLYGPFRTVALL
jgi:hypothetical protein